MKSKDLVVREVRGVAAQDTSKSVEVSGFYKEPFYPEEMTHDINKSKETQFNNRSANTLRKYYQCWDKFSEYCNKYKVSALPADPVVICAFLENTNRIFTEVNGEYFSASNSKIRSLVAAINFFHEKEEYDSPTKSPMVKEQLKGMFSNEKRSLVNNTKRALVDEYFCKIVNYLDTLDPTPSIIRDRAILLLGRQGGFRRSELAALKLSDLEFKDGELYVTVKFHKSSKDGSNILVKRLPKSELYSCYEALSEWLSVSKIRSGHVFRSLHANGQIRIYFDAKGHTDNMPDKIKITQRTNKPRTTSSGFLTGQDIYRIVTGYVSKSGIPAASMFAPHSLRSGCVTQMFLNNFQVKQIKNRTGHKSADMLDHYNQV
jgi:site-specific recombinase XerD